LLHVFAASPPKAATSEGEVMFNSTIRTALGLAFLSAALCPACGGDSSHQTNTADDANTPAAPSDSSTAPADSPTPNNDGPQGIDPGTTPTPSSGNQVTPSSSLATPSSTNQSGAAAVPAAPALSQAQIAMVTDLANASEIEQGKLAQGKAKAANVKKFAGMMVKHHTEARQEQTKLYKQLNLTPTQSQPATELKQSADNALGSLRAANGAAFDTAYIDGQVSAHEKVLKTLDEQLLPAASDQQLIDGLKKMREIVQSHLQEAKTIQAQLLQAAGDRSARAE
jgi:putative membrane protein